MGRAGRQYESRFFSLDGSGTSAGLKIALEAGNQTTWIYQHLTDLGTGVTVVNPHKAELIAGRPKKTDQVDAKILGELLPSVAV
jgi:hypothetical protein